jgi:hypothetical protein
LGGSVEPGTGVGTGDGITGTFDGTTFNAANAPQQTKTVVIGASFAQYPLYNNWTIRFLPKLGAQDCSESTGTEDTLRTASSP